MIISKIRYTYSQSWKGTWKMTMADLIAKGLLLSSDFNGVDPINITTVMITGQEKLLLTHPGLYNMTAERFSQDFERSVMDKLKEDRRPL